MEILSNIWSILTTENEMVTKIITAPSIIIEAWLDWLIFVNILKIVFSKKQRLICILLLSVTTLATEFFIPTPINVFINYIILFSLIRFILKQDIIKSILSTIIPTIIFALASTLILNPFLKLLKITSVELNNIPIYQLTYLMVLYLILFMIVYLLKYIKLDFELFDEMDKKSKRIIILNLLLGFITLAIQAVLTYYYVSILPIIITFLNLILLLAFFIISFYSMTRIIKLQITTKNLENAKNYNETLSYLYDNVKAFQHDFNNMIFIMGGYIEANDTKGLKKYYKNLEKDCERVNNVALLNPKLINNSGIYNLLMSKYKKAHEENVEIKLEFFFDFEKLKMPIYDFSRILGILLDNAIEAAKETEEKYVSILFRDSNRNKTQIISIENTYKNKEVNTTKIFEKGVSQKQNHMGMGLWEVKQILKRNNNVNLITSKDEIYFKQNLEIYY